MFQNEVAVDESAKYFGNIRKIQKLAVALFHPKIGCSTDLKDEVFEILSDHFLLLKFQRLQLSFVAFLLAVLFCDRIVW